MSPPSSEDPSFPAVTRDEWREKATRDLKGRTPESLRKTRLDGLDVPTLATAEDVTAGLADTLPGFPPFIRGRTALGPGAGGWRTAPVHACPDPVRAGEEARHAAELGAHEAWFRFDRGLRAGGSASDRGDGVIVRTAGELDALLRPIASVPDKSVYIESGITGRALHDLGNPELAHCIGGVLLDPVATLAEVGELSVSLDDGFAELAELLNMTQRPDLVGVSTVELHEAGATAVDDVAHALSSGVESLRRLDAAGVPPHSVVPRMHFQLAVGRDLFTEIAKLRAARWTWARVTEECGIDEARRGMKIHARGSRRERARRDPWVNLLRGTVESFAAVVGGADGVATVPFDEARGAPSELARRLAVNAQVLLRDEAHLARVVDPAGGSWHVESLTRRLAEAAWSRFQEIERAGGIVALLESGELQAHLARVADERDQRMIDGETPLIGVSRFTVEDDGPLPAQEPVAAPTGGEPLLSKRSDEPARVEPLRQRPLSAAPAAASEGGAP